MARTSKTQTRAQREPFNVVAQRLGDALADVLTHPNCPADIADAIEELDCRVTNHHHDVELSLRGTFGARIVGVLERPA